ncbi:hypothetical protein [Streptomyces sp. NPDC059009]|uniref:hypothetical protein n=1 Tax=Streptomyces sp. NPDC059009 TaxID=3346694 RepID=UPI0036BC4867
MTEQIKTTLSVAHELIVTAWEGRAWEALDYASWDAYCAAEFAGARMVRLEREQRREIVADMKAARMSNTAIGTAIGVTECTVRNDLKALQQDRPTSKSFEVGPPTTLGLDGKERPAVHPEPRPILAANGRRIPQRAQRDAMTSGLSTLRGLCAGFDSVDEIEPGVTADEAARWARDLTDTIRVLNKILKKVRSYADHTASDSD